MQNLKLLNKKYLSIILISLFFGFNAHSEEAVDIWSTEKKKLTKENLIIQKQDEENTPQNSIYKMQSEKSEELGIKQNRTLTSKEIKIVGLYDPDDNGLDINMWTNSDGEKILDLYAKIDKIKLSKDASEILDKLLLTNSYYPELNISKEQFQEIKSNWLIKNSNLKLIENYLINNQTVNEHLNLTKYLVNTYLSRSKIKKACEIFFKIKNPIEDQYLSKFNIYCLINDNRPEEAQLILDLKKENGFEDKFYEKKINYLMGYDDTPALVISESTILDFHLSHRTNPSFKFEPKISTSKQIWRYLSSSNLLDNIQDIELTDFNKIATIEKATHEKNYEERELYDLYKRFQFNIDQLLNIKDSSKLLQTIEARALIYQGILITSDTEKKLELLNALKNSFINDSLEGAFNKELKKFLKEIAIDDVPSNYTTFYENNIDDEKIDLIKTKINNKIIHQSKLVNYFKGEISRENITKDLNNYLKKIKKDKKYLFSKKDVILVEALKSDGIKVSKKYNNFYEISSLEMPSDIQDLIDNNEMGLAMLRIVEVIGQDEIKDIDDETMYFIINTLNQLNIDSIRNKILLKILPLKV
jgi:hypothetical protein